MSRYNKTLRPSASQETLFSLLQLDPVPMEPPDNEKDLPPLPEEARVFTAPTQHARTTSLGLSGGGGGSIYYLTRIQRFSTYALSIFTAIHISNTSLIPLFTRSVSASESYLLLAREIYQTPMTEPLFVALPIVAHFASGIALRLVRRSQNLKRYGGATPGVLPRYHAGRENSASGLGRIWPPISYISLSGYGFALFLSAHVAMNRLLPLYVEGDSSNIGLAYVAHGFARHPYTASAAYTGLLALGCGHMVWGWAKWIGLAQLAGWKVDLRGMEGSTRNQQEDTKRRKRRRRIWLWINGTAVVATTLWAAGSLGVVARGGLMPGWVGKVYNGLYETIPGL